MKFSKDEKGFVIWWIDRQFSENQLFPESCVTENKSGERSVSNDHVKAYKSWRKTEPKRSQIQEWIDRWLDKSDRKMLRTALESHRASEEENDEGSAEA